ncbi:MAG: transcriptional regulator [Deltaproteobacteria bacterium]|nr:transcriptional regulator [Deltaproteobacteria bacterium]
MKKRKKKSPERYAPARRLNELKDLINSTGGVTVYEIAERLRVSVRTAIRYVRALQASEEPLYQDREDRKTVWRLMPSARHQTITLSTSQMISLYLSRRVFDFLAGTGFKEDLDDVFARLEALLKRKDFVAARNLDRKIHDVNEAPHLYQDRIEHVNDMITALLREERLRVTHGSVAKYQKPFLLDPYTLLIYKKGLYLAGHSHHHQGLRTFSLDGFKEVEWLKGEKFEYPADYQPSQLSEGAFGLIGGPRTRVRIFFDEKVARYVRRRQWHPTQELKKVEGGVELNMEVAGTVELLSWVLGFGDKAEVLEPESLREEIGAETARVAARYSRK